MDCRRNRLDFSRGRNRFYDLRGDHRRRDAAQSFGQRRFGCPSGEGYLVKFRVKNTGDQTAASLTVEGELKNGAEIVETSAATLTYAPSHSEREGGLFFSKNPNQYQLEIRSKGYEKP